MAYGFACKHCGHQETAHTEMKSEETPKGYRLSLDLCPGFEYSKKDYYGLIQEYRADRNVLLILPGTVREAIKKLDKADGLTDYRLNAFQQQGASRGAWGMYMGVKRQEHMNKKVSDFNGEYKRAATTAKRKAVQEKFHSFLKNANTGPDFYVS